MIDTLTSYLAGNYHVARVSDLVSVLGLPATTINDLIRTYPDRVSRDANDPRMVRLNRAYFERQKAELAEKAELNAKAEILVRLAGDPLLDLVIQRFPRTTVRDLRAWQIELVFRVVDEFEIKKLTKSSILAGARKAKKEAETMIDYGNYGALVGLLTT